MQAFLILKRQTTVKFKTNYAPQVIQNSSSVKNLYQNTTNKIQPPKKIWTILLILDSPKRKNFQSPDLEIDFLIDSGAKSNIIYLLTWSEVQNLHPKFSPSKTSSKFATAQGSSVTKFGKNQI